MKDPKMLSTNEERVALVTGSGKGVGAGIVRILTSRGIKCCINCNTNRTMADELLKEIEAAGGEAILCQADVTDPEQLHNMVQTIIDKWGRLDILVNNAAMQPNLYIDMYSEEKIREIWNINIGGYFHVVRECLPYLKKSPCGRIINMSSVHGKRPTNFDTGYAMTKGAIRMFTRELAIELQQYGITVNTIDLGACKIEFKTGNAKWYSVTALDTVNRDMFKVDYQVLPTEVGELVYFLASEGAASLVGDGIRIDRGLVLR